MNSLFPPDGAESACLVLCGRAGSASHEIMCVHKIIPVPAGEYCERTPTLCRWRTEWALPHLLEAEARGLAVCKVHSHREEFVDFSRTDMISEREWFRSLSGWIVGDRPHLNLVLLPSGTILLRSSTESTSYRVTVIGDDIRIHSTDSRSAGRSLLSPRESVREPLALGSQTFELLSRLTVAIIGASGTGSIVAEQCARLGVGSILLVDPKRLHPRNVGRILHSSMSQAVLGPPKVDILKSALEPIGLGSRVTTLMSSVNTEAAVRLVSTADVIFGCTDSHLARTTLNRIATHYVIPYIDCGVRIDAEDDAEVNQISAAVHYCAPDGTWLSDRAVTSLDAARAESLAATAPAEFARQMEQGYIRGVNVDRPAVITYNMIASALAMNELLSRLHALREDGNEGFRSTRISLTQMRMVHDSEEQQAPDRSSMLGRGDRSPLLGLVGLDRPRDAA